MLRRNFLRTILAAGGVAGGALGLVGAVNAAPTPRPTLRPLSVGAARGYLARPDKPNGIGLLLQPTIAAVDGYMRTTASDLAARGHTVIVWDPYRGETAPGDTPGQLARSRRIADEDAMTDLTTLSSHLSQELGQRSIATIGWCMGGRFGLLQGGIDQRIDLVIAFNPTIYAAAPVPLYGIPTSKADFPGQTMDEFALAARIRGPVQVFRPGRDLAQPAEYQRLQAVLYSRSAPSLMSYFPEAEHGFAYHPVSLPDRAAAAIAWPATLALIDTLRHQAP